MTNDEKGRFAFIEDKILRENLNRVFADIIDFTSIMDSYNENIQNNFHRAIILYTAAIIEALLHYVIEKKVRPLEFEEEEEWCFDGDPHICHRYQDADGKNMQIITGKRFRKKKKITKNTQFKQINNIALDKKLISSDLHKRIDEIRVLRNGLHLASLEDIERKHSKQILNKAFDTAREVVEIAEAIS